MNKLIIVFLIAVMLSGCIGAESITGTYNGTNNNIKQLIIYPDSTFLVKIRDGETYSGVVRKEGDDYIFTAPLLTFSTKYDHGNLTDDKGGVYAVKVR
jgi:hypothetical protein